eukprot:Clim_evm37s134 gene=Clim_evmTU37s134
MFRLTVFSSLKQRVSSGTAPRMRSKLAYRAYATRPDSAAQSSGSFDPGFDMGTAVLYVIPLITFGLGSWQIKRLFWKRELQANIDGNVTKEPIDISKRSDFDQLGQDYTFRRVRLHGTIENQNEYYLGPRALVGDDRVIMNAGEQGYQVVVPFVLKDGTRIILNRGWVPMSKMEPATRPSGQIEDETEVVAVTRKGEKANSFVPDNQWENRRLFSMDVDSFAAKNNTLPFVMDADAVSAPPGGIPYGSQTNIKLRDEHLQYVITWYSLTGFLLYGLYVFRNQRRAAAALRAPPKF